MQRALLLYNPSSGRSGALRTVELAVAQFRSAGVDARAEPTAGPGMAGEQARRAVAAGTDTVIACGGDGTVHDILQGMVGGHGILGVLPLGTGNALASDLGLSCDVTRVVRALSGGKPHPVAVGQLTTASNELRYFIVGVGVGADAYMAYRMSARLKRRFGLLAYYLESTRQLATHPFPSFSVEYRDLESGELCKGTATQVLAIRITRFAGLLKRLAPGAALYRNDLRLVVFHTRSRLRYAHYLWNVLWDRGRPVPGVEFAYARNVVCTPLDSSTGGTRIYLEADGELLGCLPVEITIPGATVNLLMPAAAWPE